MNRLSERTYRTAEFAALAGVTTRALHHYDRLGLLTPKRSDAGYRLYSERDLEALEEIVALKFIGVPLKKIAAMRRRSSGALVDVLRAQRAALEDKRHGLTRAVEAIARAEAALQSGAVVDAALFRQIIEVMQMDTTHEDTIEKYSAMLKAKMSHLMAMSPADRDALRQAWTSLIDDIRRAAAANERPDSPRAQQLLDRWTALFQQATGADAATAAEQSATPTFRATSELRDAVWARRADWMPEGAARDADGVAVDHARARAENMAQSFASPDVMAFITQAREARR